MIVREARLLEGHRLGEDGVVEVALDHGRQRAHKPVQVALVEVAEHAGALYSCG